MYRLHAAALIGLMYAVHPHYKSGGRCKGRSRSYTDDVAKRKRVERRRRLRKENENP